MLFFTLPCSWFNFLFKQDAFNNTATLKYH